MAEYRQVYFDVSVHYVFGVHVINSIANAHENTSNHALIFKCIVAYAVEQSSILSILEYNVRTLLLFIEVVI